MTRNGLRRKNVYLRPYLGWIDGGLSKKPIFLRFFFDGWEPYGLVVRLYVYGEQLDGDWKLQ